MHAIARHLLCALFLALVAFSTHAEAPPLGLTTEGVVTRVIDADTLEVEVRYKVRVRLLDAWAPEKNTPIGTRAYEEVRAIAENGPVVLHVPTGQARSVADLLTLNRVLGHVWLPGLDESLSEWLVRRKLASTTKTGRLGE